MSQTENTVPRVKHVAIAGNIGAGKTTLSSQLAKSFSWDVHYEDTSTNPYLADFADGTDYAAFAPNTCNVHTPHPGFLNHL